MNALLASPVFARLGWALLHALWEVTLVVLVAALGLRLMRGGSPRLRCAVAVLALFASVLLPLRRVVVVPRSAAASTGLVLGMSGLPSRMLEAPAPGPSTRTRMEDGLGRTLPWIVGIWGAGVMVCLLRLGGGWVWLQRLRWRKAELAPDALQARLLGLCRRAALRRAVTLLTCEGIRGPSVVGFLRPAILVPAGWFLHLPPDHVEALLAHELAHVLRHDYAVNLLQSLAEVLLFYHPGIWWLSRRIRAERELACDAFAARLLGDPLPLAEALVNLETRALGHTPYELSPAAHGGSLMERIRQLLSPQPRTSAAPMAGALMIGLFTLASGLHLSAQRPGYAPATPPAIPFEEGMEAPALYLATHPIQDGQGKAVPYQWNLTLLADQVPLVQAWKAFQRYGIAPGAVVKDGTRFTASAHPTEPGPKVNLEFRKVSPAVIFDALQALAKQHGMEALQAESLDPFSLVKRTDKDGIPRFDVNLRQISPRFLRMWLDVARKEAAASGQTKNAVMSERTDDLFEGPKVDAVFTAVTLAELEKGVEALLKDR